MLYLYLYLAQAASRTFLRIGSYNVCPHALWRSINNNDDHAIEVRHHQGFRLIPCIVRFSMSPVPIGVRSD